VKLAAKLIFTVVLSIAMVLAVDGYASYKRQHDLYQQDMIHDTRVLGMAIQQLVVDSWRSGGQARALKVIKDANKVEPTVDIRWIWLDAPPGDTYAPHVSSDKLSAVVQGREASIIERDEQGTGNFYSYFPVGVNDPRSGGLEIHESLAVLDALDRNALIKVIGLTSALVLFSGCAALLLGIRMVGHPLDAVVAKMRRVGQRDFSGPLRISGRDELRELAVGVNTMCEQLEEAWTKVQKETAARIAALEQLRHEDRLKTVGRLASGIAHELGTPLNVISGYAGMIAERTLSSQEITESAGTIKTQSERIAGIIRQLLDFARQRSGRKTICDLGLLTNQTVALMDPLAQKQDIHLVMQEGDTNAAVRVDVEQIKQVLLNLMTNALQAMSRGGRLEVGIVAAPDSLPAGRTEQPAQYIGVYVQDEGDGIPEENLQHIFEPFFTTKVTGKGTGLGLSIAEGIIREHGGWITVDSAPGRGSRFSVYLPKEGDVCRDTC